MRTTRRDAIALWTENVLDLNIAVDDARAALARALEDLRARVRERNHAADTLADLVRRHDSTVGQTTP